MTPDEAKLALERLYTLTGGRLGIRPEVVLVGGGIDPVTGAPAGVLVVPPVSESAESWLGKGQAPTSETTPPSNPAAVPEKNFMEPKPSSPPTRPIQGVRLEKCPEFPDGRAPWYMREFNGHRS